MRHAYWSLLATAFAALGACNSCPPETRARILAPDFHTAEGTALSFLAALSCDEPQAEYLCFGEALKDQYGATLDLYLLARPSLLSRIGPMYRYADSLTLSRNEPTANGVRLWFRGAGAERVGFDLSAQYYFEVYLSNGTRKGAFLDKVPSSFVSPATPPTIMGAPKRIYFGVERKAMVVEIESSVIRGISPDEIEGFEIRTEWKIADFLLPAEEQDSPRP